MATWKFPKEVASPIEALASMLDARQRARLAPVLVGLLFAQGRRTVASWLRAAGVGRDFKPYYYCLGSVGRKTTWLAGHILRLVRERVAPGERIVLALDDSPTKRYGPCIEGAGIHHNPTPGPAGQKFLYGHVWVVLAWVTRHPWWGAIALPLLSRLYVRAKDVKKLPRWYRWKFRTKLELAGDLVAWAAERLRSLGKTLCVVADGAYAKRPFLQRAAAAGVIVISRLRKDAALHSVPSSPNPGERRRGRPRKYGEQRIDLAKRAGHNGGWRTESFTLYGRTVVKTYKMFLATYRPAGGLIRVVLVKEDDGWRAYFSTDHNDSVANILEAVADRAAIEQTFHDLKEVHGAGQQQLRNVWANIAAWHLNQWMYTLVELWAWGRSHAALCDRRDSPWDDPARRPSHADRCKALRHECLRDHFSRLLPNGRSHQKLRRALKALTRRAA